MKICVFTLGTEGDVRPFLALGRRFKKLGHRMVILTDASQRELIEGEGIEHAAVKADFAQVMAWNRARASGTNLLAMSRDVNRALVGWVPHLVERGLATARGAGLIIVSGWGTIIGGSIARKHGIPFVQAQFMPVTPSRHLPPPWLLTERRLPGWLNHSLGHATRHAGWMVLRQAGQAVRRELDMPPFPWRGPWYDPIEIKDASRVLYAFSRHIQPKPTDWPHHRTAVVGFWRLDESESWRPPAALREFLRCGARPIYVGFGSMVSTDAREFTDTILQGIRLSGRRAIVSVGWGALSREAAVPDGVFVIDRAPHRWLFSQVDLAVHHGGAGTMAAAARAGLPQVVIPFIADQPYWALRLKALGVSPVLLKQETLTAEKLATAIREAGTEPFRARARALQDAMVAEDGVGNAVAALRRWGLLPDEGREREQAAAVGG